MYISIRYCVVWRGTQQGNSATKHAFTRRSWATLGRANEVSFQGMFICTYKQLITDRLICEGSEKFAYAQQETLEASQTATPIHEVCRTIIA
jgi:hypothetical protein